ncbi:hypothetical protein CCMSSC00406_0009038 [Pleurotus cornucopiae]|uniref:Uncharacterized protein n=1 Tax=Pleurotus cornucopiae TaxID=5321 RepID=A0ACB7IVB0_PLECO|nr:hypothetical protein CCMSSC00406_0009038 [Pleurotus cornucopiae]
MYCTQAHSLNEAGTGGREWNTRDMEYRSADRCSFPTDNGTLEWNQQRHTCCQCEETILSRSMYVPEHSPLSTTVPSPLDSPDSTTPSHSPPFLDPRFRNPGASDRIGTPRSTLIIPRLYPHNDVIARLPIVTNERPSADHSPTFSDTSRSANFI